MTTFTNKSSARSAVKSVLSTYGVIAGLALLHETVSAKVAGTRGRSTLEEVPFHTVRRTIDSLRKEVQTDEDKAFEAPRVTKEDRNAMKGLLAQYGTDGVLSILGQLFPNTKAIATGTELHTAAMERLAERRALFTASPKAYGLKLVTLEPNRDE